MANELKAKGTPSNSTMTAVLIRSSDGYIWDTAAASYAATPTAANAANSMAESGSTGRYIGSIPAAALTAAAGYSIKVEYVDVVPGSFAYGDAVAERETVDVDDGGSIVTMLTRTASISAKQVADDRTHFAGVNTYQASNIITVNQNFVGTLSFQPSLNPDTAIQTVDSVSITGAATVTATGLGTTADRKRANYTVPALTVTGTYTVLVTITTTDSQTIPITGTLEVV